MNLHVTTAVMILTCTYLPPHLVLVKAAGTIVLEHTKVMLPNWFDMCGMGTHVRTDTCTFGWQKKRFNA